MQLPKVINSKELIQQINKTNLYDDLIKQLNKDFVVVGIDIEFNTNETPKELFSHLQEVVTILLQRRFDDFLNILYRIDIDENQIKTIINDMKDGVEKQISFLILKREWQKVWLKRFY